MLSKGRAPSERSVRRALLAVSGQANQAATRFNQLNFEVDGNQTKEEAHPSHLRGRDWYNKVRCRDLTCSLSRSLATAGPCPVAGV